MTSMRKVRIATVVAVALALVVFASVPATARINSSARATPIPAGVAMPAAGIAMRSFWVHEGPSGYASAGDARSFHWDDAGVGAAVTAALALLLASAAVRASRRDRRANAA